MQNKSKQKQTKNKARKTNCFVHKYMLIPQQTNKPTKTNKNKQSNTLKQTHLHHSDTNYILPR